MLAVAARARAGPAAGELDKVLKAALGERRVKLRQVS